MSLEVEFDNNGKRHVEFALLREELLQSGDTFANHLNLVHYSQLPLCSIANAGSVRCDPKLVSIERSRRRSRFVQMDLTQLEACRRYLDAQGMYSDVLEEIHLHRAVEWAEISNHQKLYFKLVCLYNHLDLPAYRYEEALEILRKIIEKKEWEGNEALRSLQALYRLRAVSETYPLDEIRAVLGGLIEELYQLLNEEQRVIVQAEVLRGYQCTHGCFQAHTKVGS